MNRELRRLLELSGQKDKNDLVSHLYENYGEDETYVDDEGNRVIKGQGPLSGLEGPFRMKNGRIVYYDPKEGKYYDRRSDRFLDQEEADALHEALIFVPGVILCAIRGNEKLNLRLEHIAEMRPMVALLRNNGFDDFEYSDGEEEPVAYDDKMGADHGEMSDPIHDIHNTVDRLMGALGSGQELSPEVKDHLAQAAEYLGMAADSLVGDNGDMEPDMDHEMEPDMEPDMDHDMDHDMEPQMESETVTERELTDAEKEKLDKYKKKYEGSKMHKAMIKQYGEEKGNDVFYAKLTKAAKGEEELEEAKQSRSRDTKVYPSTSRGLDKKQQKAARSKERKQGREQSKVYEAYAKGDKVMYGDKEVYVVVPDGPTDLVGVSDKMGGKVDMVKADKLKKYEKMEEAAVSATVYDNDAMPADAVDDEHQKGERTGRVDRTETKNVVPKEVHAAIDQRITELKASVAKYDNKGYAEPGVKHLAIDALKQIKKNLQGGDHEGFMQAQIFFTTLMSPIWDLIPAQVVNYLAKGDDRLDPDAA